jgi:tetratricopeptide (TPR) repeat protein
MIHELLFAVVAGLILLYLLSRIATTGGRQPVNPGNWSNTTSPNLHLYRAAEELFDQKNFAAASATVLYVTSDENHLLAGNAWLMLAQCYLHLKQPVDALDAADSGRRMIAESQDRDSHEMRRLNLAFLVLKASSLTQIKGGQEIQWHVLEEARGLAEAEDFPFETPDARNLYLAFCYHNLGVLCQTAGDHASAVSYYQRATAHWENLPERQEFSEHLEAARGGLLDCGGGAKYLDRMFGLDYKGPDN